MRKLLFFIVLLLFIIVGSGAWYYSRFQPKNISAQISVITADSIKDGRRMQHSYHLKEYALANKYNSQLGFFIDMSLESGKNRFFIVDLQKNRVIDAGLVTHGRCNQTWLKGRKYSNSIGGGCTSLGKYKIGAAYQGRFGLAYKLHGLDSSNNNAFKRFVVLHGMSCVPDKESFPFPICQSDGCPAVSPAFLKKLQLIIDAAAKPILLYMYE